MYNDKIIYGILLKLYFIDRMSILKIDLLTPWQGGPTLKPSASTESTKSGPPPPGCIIKDLWVDDGYSRFLAVFFDGFASDLMET